MKSEENVSTSKLRDFATDFVAGGLSGIAAKTVSAPLDRVKLLMQTQAINPSVRLPYASSWSCAVRVVREEGVLSLWRGNVANVYRYFPSQAFNFAFKDQFRKVFVPERLEDGNKLATWQVSAAKCPPASTPISNLRTLFYRSRLEI